MQLICQLTAQFMSPIPTPRLHWPLTVVIFLQLPPTACLPVYMFTVALLCTAGVINKQRPCNYALELSLQLPVGVKIAYWHKLISQQHPASQPASQPPPAVGPDWPNWPATRVANWLAAPWGQCVPSWGLNTLNYATCSVYCICVYRLLWPSPRDSLLKI